MRLLIVIPSRLESARLPKKPLVKLQGIPMIQKVFENVQNADIAPVWVAYDDDEIGSLFPKAHRVKTGKCLTGTDRIAQALEIREAWDQFDVIINVQGDTPVLDTGIFYQLFAPFCFPEVSVVTAVSKMKNQEILSIPSKVKALCTTCALHGYWRCVDFKRAIEIPDPSMTYRNHWGVYAFRPLALKQFRAWPPSLREQEQSLEQLRFLDNGHSIWAAEAFESAPYMCVDTSEDLEKVKNFLEKGTESEDQ
ncbi:MULTISPECIES: cytidylyltransferase domain-containing protein [Holospora]|uniref:3-deoxy-manno-octulosonate cytidylyltransferase n=2 Tax=Holospora TaxID=44747 RepID=A0A061JHS3_9PROT|nr:MULTISPECIES: 3-deoxy-manno-octulosonate cytidylyltransferase [Holospora]ETZ05022.1 3-deoxy-manno-octulosonate cytidylyltransferase [Holospora undulata HU1]GAJ45813.1 3-deoxy-manno-octulosonate cytidylyltransferase [Holospora elegans E1]